MVDTVNIRAKAATSGGLCGSMTSVGLVNEIWRKEGAKGFGKGFSATFYSATACGFIYFTFYKFLKGVTRDFFGEE